MKIAQLTSDISGKPKQFHRRLLSDEGLCLDVCGIQNYTLVGIKSLSQTVRGFLRQLWTIILRRWWITSLSEEKGEVKIVCLKCDSRIEVEIRDSGIGIKDEDIGKLFQPFQQLDTGISRKYEGTGLGLSVCKRILDMLGGDIRVKSQFGKGSTFTFTVPLNPKEENDEKENPDHWR